MLDLKKFIMIIFDLMMKIYEFTKQIVESCEACQKRKVMTTRSKETVINCGPNRHFKEKSTF